MGVPAPSTVSNSEINEMAKHDLVPSWTDMGWLVFMVCLQLIDCTSAGSMQNHLTMAALLAPGRSFLCQLPHSERSPSLSAQMLTCSKENGQ